MPNRGAEFERLVQWIAATIHDGATVTPNAEVPDVDSGQLREVDILIEERKGLARSRVIGEVRNRRNVQGTEWIEQLVSKMRSVRATAAFAVSSSGFSAPAMKKAAANNIVLYDLDEALGTRWEHVVRPTAINVVTHSVAMELTLLDERTRSPFEPAPGGLGAWTRGVRGAPPYTLADLVGHPLVDDIRAIRRRAVEATALARKGGGACEVVRFEHTMLVGTSRFRDAYGNARRVRTVLVTAKVTNVVKPEPLSLLVLRESGSESARAQVFRGEVVVDGGRWGLEMLTEGLGAFIPAGSKVGFRLTPVDTASAEKFDGFEVEMFQNGATRADGYTPVSVHFSVKTKAGATVPT